MFYNVYTLSDVNVCIVYQGKLHTWPWIVYAELKRISSRKSRSNINNNSRRYACIPRNVIYMCVWYSCKLSTLDTSNTKV